MWCTRSHILSQNRNTKTDLDILYVTEHNFSCWELTSESAFFVGVQLLKRKSSLFFFSFKKLIKFLCVREFCLHAWLCITCVQCSQRPKVVRSSGTRVTDICELPWGCWESNPGLLEEQPVLWATRVSNPLSPWYEDRWHCKMTWESQYKDKIVSRPRFNTTNQLFS